MTNITPTGNIPQVLLKLEPNPRVDPVTTLFKSLTPADWFLIFFLIAGLPMQPLLNQLACRDSLTRNLCLALCERKFRTTLLQSRLSSSLS